MSAFPTVELREGAFYWIKRAYSDDGLWTVARWEHGIFWDLKGAEVTPRIISGPIPPPAESDAYSPSEASAGKDTRDELLDPLPPIAGLREEKPATPSPDEPSR